MNDYEYVFKQDVKSKKSTAQSARKMNRTGKGAVKFPSDYLTKKEKSKLNGPVTTYDMGKPMVWKDFSKLPDDIKRAYIEGLIAKYRATANQMAQMFGISKTYVDHTCARLNIKRPKGGQPTQELRERRLAEWNAFLGVDPETPKEEPKEEYVAPVMEAIIFDPAKVEEASIPKIVTARERILSRAKSCVLGDRDEEYGTPENNFGTIAAMWNAFLGTDGIRPSDVAAMLALVKVARIASGHSKEDSWVDLAGYAACGGELDELSRRTSE